MKMFSIQLDIIRIYFSLLLVYLINLSDGGPVLLSYDTINFEDPWDFKIKPHGVPLLKDSKNNHILPEFSKRMSKSTESVVLDENMKQTLRDSSKKIGDSVRRKISCSTCKLGLTLLQGEVHKNTPFDELKEKFISICVGFKIETEPVCGGIFEVYAPDLLPAVNAAKIGPSEICSLIFGESCGNVENPLHEWTLELPVVSKPPLEELPLPEASSPTFKVLHLSDTHFDPDYLQETPANCDEPLCCRSYSSIPAEGILELSGKWGSYSKCDTPKILLDNMLTNIAENHKDIDYIIWTGDLPPHDVWNQTRSDNLGNIKYTVRQMFDMFPNIPIFPALGNHEGVPAGSFPPPWVSSEDRSITWLYEELQNEWTKWLPADVNNTILHGGFYSVLLRPGFRVVSLNMNYCYSISWWLLVNSTDPAHELKWLIHELQQAENNKEKVHIIGHVPPGDADCLKVWSKNYYHIINRYESTVTAQFFGHTHADEFEVFYDENDPKRATNIAFIGPSVTTFENNNPGFRIYYVDGDHEKTTREVIDHESFYFNLQKANEDESNENPQWKKLYSAREAFGLNSLRPQEWSELIDRMVMEPKLFDLFFKFYYRDSPTRPSCADNKCKLEILCDLKTGKSHERHIMCAELEDILR